MTDPQHMNVSPGTGGKTKKALRLFHCDKCGHNLRLGSRHCGQCWQPTPFYNRFGFYKVLTVVCAFVVVYLVLA